ncbi:NUDIX domain-containing protein [Azospirillum doebereinerae]
MDRRHRILDRRIALSNSRFDVMSDHIAGPEGGEVPDFLMVRPKVRGADLVAGVCVLPVVEGRIGLMRVHRPHFDRPLWVAPSGFLEPDESPEISARRELEEEAGLTCDPAELRPLGLLLLDPGVLEARVALFAASSTRPLAAPPPGSSLGAAPELGAGRLILFAPDEAEELALTSPDMDGGTVAACLRWAALGRRNAAAR